MSKFLVPIAISSAIDQAGNERFHASGYTRVRRPTFGSTFLTSRPYPVDVIEGLETLGRPISGYMYEAPVNMDAAQSLGSVLAGEIRQILIAYPNWPIIAESDESIQSLGSVLSGEIRTILLAYPNWPLIVDSDESIESLASVLSGSIATILVPYVNWPYHADTDESLKSLASIQSGTLV